MNQGYINHRETVPLVWTVNLPGLVWSCVNHLASKGLHQHSHEFAVRIQPIYSYLRINLLYSFTRIYLDYSLLQLFFYLITMTSIIRTSGQMGPVLKRLRKAKGWSQLEFGRRIGLSQERISAIENHPERVTLDQMLTILMALGAEIQIESRSAPNEDDSKPAKDDW